VDSYQHFDSDIWHLKSYAHISSDLNKHPVIYFTAFIFWPIRVKTEINGRGNSLILPRGTFYPRKLAFGLLKEELIANIKQFSVQLSQRPRSKLFTTVRSKSFIVVLSRCRSFWCIFSNITGQVIALNYYSLFGMVSVSLYKWYSKGEA
jgi:hypothetical protein